MQRIGSSFKLLAKWNTSYMFLSGIPSGFIIFDFAVVFRLKNNRYTEKYTYDKWIFTNWIQLWNQYPNSKSIKSAPRLRNGILPTFKL